MMFGNINDIKVNSFGGEGMRLIVHGEQAGWKCEKKI